ncbi:hypothetical protein JR316_0011312 [Psilocybe cubensis]|uniref:Uncharacterized protein n=1 Tax=Psilocybe cubensis TaxID=181762 RepID=A0ACB8GJP5_PSICU|nr:hypothetical protein JR316_0011312 [Psilocybe cubensis]KAH9475753.1 hypothetical protein JR316_0011312 [Psilocybe cubensis]
MKRPGYGQKDTQHYGRTLVLLTRRAYAPLRSTIFVDSRYILCAFEDDFPCQTRTGASCLRLPIVLDSQTTQYQTVRESLPEVKAIQVVSGDSSRQAELTFLSDSVHANAAFFREP